MSDIVPEIIMFSIVEEQVFIHSLKWIVISLFKKIVRIGRIVVF